jgi:putative MATE family efflux protein
MSTTWGCVPVPTNELPGSKLPESLLKAETAGISLLTGDPKTAIVKLSLPMIVAMLLMSTYNIVNAIWVAGLGSDDLAAVGFMTPIFMILIGLGIGIGAGVTSAISRKIGAGDRAGANNTAVHAILITLIISAIITIPLVLFAEPIALLFGAGKTAGLAAEYGRIIFCGIGLILFTNISYGILRAEGDTKRTMYVMCASSILNLILDPILIYTLGMGIAGAAWGMIISISLVTVVLLYWFFWKKDTYVSLGWKEFSPNIQTVRDILGVGLPASLEFFLMSVLAIIINIILVMVAGTDAVAVYTAGWRVVMFAIIPLAAIGTSVISVAGAAYGARQYDKLPVIHTFSVTLGVIIAVSVSILTWLFAQQIAIIFTYSPESAHLAPAIAAFLGIMCFFYPFVAPGIMSGSVFQGTGKGLTSLVINIFRNLVFIALFAYVFGIVLGMGETGVWWGIVVGDILGGSLGYIWARIYISRLCANR